MIEVLASFSIIMFLVITILPPLATLYNEREEIKNRLLIYGYLHDHLQQYIYDGKNLENKEIELENNTFFLEWSMGMNDLVKGCGIWDAGGNRKKVCLYGKKG